ncbi:MAG: DsbA family protein [Terriglobia bacterium]
MSRKLIFGIFAVLIVGALPVMILRARPASRALSEQALREKLSDFIRAKYAVPSNVKMAVGPCESSQDTGYYECLLTVDNGQKKSSQTVSISRNGRFVAMSPLLFLGPDTRSEVAREVRVYFKMGPQWRLSVAPLRQSEVPGYYAATVTAEENGQKRNQNFYVTADKKFAVLGQVYILRTPQEVAKMINTSNQPCSGPADAPVTVVEYADLECPSCARLQPVLENDVVPRYGNKVRVIYKDFPLPMHDWSRKAAVASQCAYQIDPSAFVRYRSSIFAHQSEINVTNVREQLLSLGEAAGIDRLRLAACIDSNASLPRVEADLREGQALQVNMTPTCFVNGKEIVGLSPDELYKTISADLQHANHKLESRN